ncbi:MAG: hypothetical protein ACYDEF_03715 [Methanosarcina sp.]
MVGATVQQHTKGGLFIYIPLKVAKRLNLKKGDGVIFPTLEGKPDSVELKVIR